MNRLGNALKYIQTEAHKKIVASAILREKKAISIAHGKYHSKKYWSDLGFRFQTKWRARLSAYMRARLLTDRPSRFGCTQWELREHIESQMSGDMWWDNYGTLWEVDHVVPVCNFDLPKEIFQCNHYTNLRPRLVSLNMLDGMKLGNKTWYPLRNS